MNQPVEFSERRRVFGPAQVSVRGSPDGSLWLANALALPTHAASLLERLEHWAAVAPERLFIAEREALGWREVSYAQALLDVDALAGALVAMPLTVERPLLVMSANSVEHALVVLAAMRVGIPVAVVSPLLASSDPTSSRLQIILEKLTPGAVYCGAGVDLESACGTLRRLGIPVVADSPRPEFGMTALRASPRCPHSMVQARRAAATPDAPAKILFTSGSTGSPKGVIITQRMMCSNAAGLAVVWPFLSVTPPILLDWLPWSHVFGGNCCFNLSLYYGGSFYIDDGKPVGEGIARTVDNLARITPNVYFNVPSGYEALVAALEDDEAVAHRLFSAVFFLFNAAAALPTRARTRVEALARRTIGRCPPIIGGWGSTETAPFATVVCFDSPFADNLGIPMPGTTIKMVPDDDRYEMRVKGPNVTPGYWREPELSRSAFDAQGFYRIGDAGRFADPQHPERGIRFDGRLAENFKLTTGTWVNVGMLRLDLVNSIKPYVDDVVITGHGRDSLGALVFPAFAACRRLIGNPPDLDDHDLVAHPEVVAAIRRGLEEHAARQCGSSTRIARFAILATPPSREAGERTDKGSINQRAVITARAADVAALYTTGRIVGAEDERSHDDA